MRTFVVFAFAVVHLVSCASISEQEISVERVKRLTRKISFQGCFGGNPNFIKSRKRSDNINFDCAEYCRDNGLIIAATRGSFCGCTNTLLSPQLARPESDKASGANSKCNIRCPGVWNAFSCRGDECCGGGSAYSVYVVGQIDVMKQVLRRTADNLRANNARKLKEEFGDTPFRYVRQDSSGRCFNPQGGSASPGDNTRVLLGYGCDEPRYWFQLLSDGSIKHVTSGKCLHPFGGSSNPSDGTKVVVFSGCNGKRLQFEITSGGLIRHKTSNKCLRSQGTKVVFHTSCDDADSSKFTFVSTAPRRLESVRQVTSGKCWHPRGGSTEPSDDSDVVIHSGCGKPKNWFEMLPDGSIRHVPSGKCLHPKGGSANPWDDTSLVIHSGCGESRLQFRVLSNGCIQHKTSGKCLHPKGGSAHPSDDTTVVIHSGCGHESRLFWKFVRLNIPALPDFIIRTVGETISDGKTERKECIMESTGIAEKSFTCSAVSDTPSLLIEFKSMTRELKHGFGKNLTPLGKYDSELDNSHAATENKMTKEYSVSDTTSNTFHTEAGVSLSSTIGTETTVDVGVASASVSTEINISGFFSAGYQHETSTTKTETLNVEVTVPAYSKGLVNLFQESYPLEIKWRALLFAKGTVYVSCAGLTKRYHVSEVLNYSQRELFTFGTIDFGERDKIVAIVKIVDRDGKVINSIAPKLLAKKKSTIKKSSG